MAPTAPILDDWLPDPQIRTHHRRSSAADPDALWAAANSVRLRQTRTIGRLVRWRIPGVAPEQTFAGLLGEYPFVVLARDYPHLDWPEAFRAWHEPRTVRVVFAHWVERGPDGASTLVSESRVQPTDGVAAMRLRSLWLVVGPGVR